MPPSRRTPPAQHSDSTCRLIPEYLGDPGFDVRSTALRRFNDGSGLLISLFHTCRIKSDFSSTLTTNALNISHLRRFEACFRQPTSAGLPPSFLQLCHKMRSASFPLLFVCLRHTLNSADENRNGSEAHAIQGLSRISLHTHWVSNQIPPKAESARVSKEFMRFNC